MNNLSFFVKSQRNRISMGTRPILALFFLAILAAPELSSAADFAGTLKGVTVTDQAGTNAPPKAMINYTQSGGTIDFNANASTDSDGTIAQYKWDFGDGATGVGVATTHQFSSGTFPVTLTVVDDKGAVALQQVTIDAGLPINIAPLAVATASSQVTTSPAKSAIDTVAGGYPGDETKEWVSYLQKVGAWLNLAWTQSYTIDKIVLYDRPNLTDQITAATIVFSDGSSVTTGALNNDGSGITINFAPRNITSLRLTVSQVSAKTSMIGLSEIEVYGR